MHCSWRMSSASNARSPVLSPVVHDLHERMGSDMGIASLYDACGNGVTAPNFSYVTLSGRLGF